VEFASAERGAFWRKRTLARGASAFSFKSCRSGLSPGKVQEKRSRDRHSSMCPLEALWCTHGQDVISVS